MKNEVLVKTKNTTKVVSILINNKIYFRDMKNIKDYLYFKIELSSLEKLNNLLDIVVVKYYGESGVISFIKKHYILLVSFLLTYSILLILSKVIFSVEVVTNNLKVKESVLYELKEYGIEKYKFVKSRKEIEYIKSKILENNKDTLEWIEITKSGTKYIVNLTPRVIDKTITDDKVYDIVSKKDALIKNIIVSGGSSVKEVNEVVKKGEVIISSDIIKFDKVVGKRSAKGKVYAEVWYTVNISVPYNHVVYQETGKTINHIYLDIFGKKFTIMGKYKTNNSLNETTTLVDKPYLLFKVMKESKELYSYKKVSLSEEETYNEAIKRADKIINDKLDTDEHIIERKVLKNNSYSSKIVLELFYRVYEDITEYKEVTLESE